MSKPVPDLVIPPVPLTTPESVVLPLPWTVSVLAPRVVFALLEVSVLPPESGLVVSSVALPLSVMAPTVRPAVPRYVLRGVSGEAFGRTYPIHGTTTIGRSPECTLRLDESGISRVHARLQPTEDGMLLEDLGSSNGSYVNDKRVLRGEAKIGDEIGFDTLRFRLTAPGQTEQVPAERKADSSRLQVSPWPWIALATVALAAIWLMAALR